MTDPKAEDKDSEQIAQEKLDVKASISNTKHECFWCDTEYNRHDAIAAGVPLEYSETYCTAGCMQEDLERMAESTAETD